MFTMQKIRKKLDQLVFWLVPRMYRASQRVDSILREVMENGAFVGLDDSKTTVVVRYKGRNYCIFAGDRWRSDLSSMFDTKTMQFIYERRRPSRKVQLEFWGWLAENGVVHVCRDYCETKGPMKTWAFGEDMVYGA